MRHLPTLCVLAVFLLASSQKTLPQQTLEQRTERQKEIEQGSLWLDACEVEPALRLFERLQAALPGLPEVAFQLGRSHLAQNQFDSALEWLTRATELDPGNADYYLLLGEANGRKARAAGLFSQIGLARAARAGFEKAVELDPGQLQARRNLVEFYARAPAIMGGGEEKAAEQVAAIAERDPVLGHEARGLLLRWQQKDEEAIAEYRLAIGSAPKQVLARFQLGLFFFERKRYADAAETFVKTLQVAPDHKLAQYHLGEAAARAGAALQPATAALERYLSLAVCNEDPQHADARFWLGRLFEQSGDRKGAVSAYRSVLEQRPRDRRAKQALKRVERAGKGSPRRND